MKPMLAATCDDITKLRFPLLATPKIDGIRCLVHQNQVISRSLKLIPNKYIRAVLGHLRLNGLDGELYLKSIKTDFFVPARQPTFQEVTSAVMSEEGEPNFVYRVFDLIIPTARYSTRMAILSDLKNKIHLDYDLKFASNFEFLFPVTIYNHTELMQYLQVCLAEGHEGVMARHPDGGYKFGRSTFNEHGLIKIKPFEDDEAEIIGFEEMMYNSNEATINALGRTERSHHQAGMIGKGTLGALVCKSKLWPNVTFNIGTGFDDATRNRIWLHAEKIYGSIVKYKYQKIGSLDRPRCPVFLGFRSALDTDS